MMNDEGTKYVRSAERDPFVEHLIKASEIVQSWPEWKQSMLGGTALKSSIKSVEEHATPDKE